MARAGTPSRTKLVLHHGGVTNRADNADKARGPVSVGRCHLDGLARNARQMSGTVAEENDVTRRGLIGVGDVLRQGRLEKREKDAAQQDGANLQFPHGRLR